MRKVLQPFLVLLALAGILVISGCAGNNQSPLEKMDAAFADLRAEVQVIVVDPERAAQANTLIDQLQQTYTATAKSMQSRKTRMRELNEDYYSSRASMDEQMELVIADLRANQQVVLVAMGQLSTLLTPEEKDQLSKAKSKALNLAVASMEVI